MIAANATCFLAGEGEAARSSSGQPKSGHLASSLFKRNTKFQFINHHEKQDRENFGIPCCMNSL